MTPRTRLASLTLLSLGLLGACATRPTPLTFPPSSAASPDAAAGAIAATPVALASHPPLPGEPSGAWTGLTPRDAADHSRHGQRHGASNATETEVEHAH